jgi:hypothetical protein
MLARLSTDHARALGVPVGMANMCGEHAVAEVATRFSGLSSIVDGEGEVRARLGGEEGAIVAEVMHGDLRRQGTSIGRQRYWAAPMPWYSPAWPATQHLCAVGYRRERKRRRSARSASAM